MMLRDFSLIVVVFAVTASARSLDVQKSPSASLEDEQIVGDVSMECVSCQAAIHAAQKYLFPKLSETQIVGYITSFCEVLNVTTPENCVFLGKMVGAELWRAKDDPPERVCEELQVCKPSQVFAGVDFLTAIGLGKNGSVECKLCKDAIAALKDLVLSEEPEIAEEVESLFCDALPKETADTCKKALDQDLPYILEKYLVPEQICGYVNMC